MGRVFDIQRFCLHDGPGLRTTVFLKGCPLRCRWCSNPESQLPGPELFYNRSRCMKCFSCVAACPGGLISHDGDDGVAIRRGECDACGACEDVCPMGAVVRKGSEMTVDDIVRQVARDAEFYSGSGGGVTFSGGEPFAQPAFLREALAAVRAEGISTAVETTAYVEWDVLESCLPLLDHVLVDVKHADAAKHREWTGVNPDRIHRNIRRLLQTHSGTRLRIPVIPGFNDDTESLDGLADFVAGVGGGVELLPYHALGEGKYAMLDRPYLCDPALASEGPAAATKMLAHFRARDLDAIIDS